MGARSKQIGQGEAGWASPEASDNAILKSVVGDMTMDDMSAF